MEGGREYLREEWAKLGPMSRGEKRTLAVYGTTVLLWMTGPFLAGWKVGGIAPLGGLSDAVVSVLGALALFLLPADRARGVRLMDWDTASNLPWGVLILFGGGLALASATEANGVPQYVGSLAAGLAGWPAWAVVLAVVAIIVFMS
jgi:sodium-dependent dicarboxylate transporter 2/3/5